ncbi:hypothetical protein [Ensifer aridi]|uniref:hypothetical protein n=1 Tax=Ensifer aridi TaxID=1708715 RepID=UPI00111BD6CB|nr:hypothetical protein [Ensifer aridi]
MKKPTLAIVSTLDDLCGIAGYARYLSKQLSDDFDVKIFDLDQYFMRGTHPSLVRRADEIIAEISEDIRSFDAVNLQLEYGIFGRKNTHIVRRFRKLAEAAPNLSITFHTILPQLRFELLPWVADIFRFRLIRAVDRFISYNKKKHLMEGVYRTIRKLQTQKNVSVIVHTRRDMRLMKHVYAMERVFDHPLAFVAPEDSSEIRNNSSRAKFPQLNRLPDGTKLIGVFGFLGEYKGFDTAIKALFHLPENYHLVIFGGLHPNEIRANQPIHPYVEKLLSSLDNPDRKSNPSNVRARVHFMGPQSDEGFTEAMAICDCVVFPYLEVGQSSSGPLSIAVDMNAPIVAARNHAFLQFSRYHPEYGETFEIGNYLELAEKIFGVTEKRSGAPERQFTTVTNAQVYRKAHLIGEE